MSRPTRTNADGDILELTDREMAQFEASKLEPRRQETESPLLGDWRRGLLRWGRLDEVVGKINALVESEDLQKRAAGLEAREMSEYALRVYRKQLLELAPLLGFTEADVDESLSRAKAVADEG